MARFTSTAGVVLALCAAFAGCSARINVSATASTPSQFTHLYITTQAVWFNTSATAGPDDSGWAKFVLKTPVTVDLVTESNGTLGEIADDLRLAPGTYNSILLLPVDPSTALTTTAQAVGASFNQEADFVDTSGNSHQVQLVLPNQEKGIVVPGTSLTVPVGGGGVPGITSSTTGTTDTTTTPITATTSDTTSTTSTTGSNTITVSFAASFDGNRDLHIFNYTAPPSSGSTTSTTTSGVLLSSSPFAANLATTGGISGTLTLTSLTNITNPNSDRVAIQACAESMSTDNKHHVVVACAPVQTDGTFTIYPLQSNSNTPATYDVVIHGPNIATIIIKNVSVTTTTPTLTEAASTTGSVATTTASGAVSIGTFIPRAAVSYPVTVSASTTGIVPPGAAATFYQTLPASGEVPYAIDEVGVDPVNLTTANAAISTPEYLSAASIDSGTYSSTGSTITVTSSTPKEGAGSYSIAGTAPMFTDGISSGGNPVVAPATTQTANGNTPVSATTPVAVTLGGLTPTSGAATATLTATITQSGSLNQGLILVSHNGAVVGSASINAALTGGGTVTVSGLPGGSSAVYYVSAIAWSTSDGTFKYTSTSTPVNLSGGSATGVTLAFD